MDLYLGYIYICDPLKLLLTCPEDTQGQTDRQGLVPEDTPLLSWLQVGFELKGEPVNSSRSWTLEQVFFRTSLYLSAFSLPPVLNCPTLGRVLLVPDFYFSKMSWTHLVLLCRVNGERLYLCVCVCPWVQFTKCENEPFTIKSTTQWCGWRNTEATANDNSWQQTQTASKGKQVITNIMLPVDRLLVSVY